MLDSETSSLEVEVTIMNSDMQFLQHNGRAMQQISNVSKGQLDLLVLRYMARRLHLMLSQLSHLIHLSQPVLCTLQERYGHTHHVALYNYQELFLENPLLFVGFISRRRCPAVVNTIEFLDEQPLGELVDTSDLLSYSSLELRNGDWCNLMLLRDADATIPVTYTRIAAYAAYQLVYGSYNWIRLHNGIMPRGLDHTQMLLQKTWQTTCHIMQ
jgi:hypothetical protein